MTLHQGIEELKAMSGSMAFPQLVQAAGGLMDSARAELEGITMSCRLQASDLNYEYAFALENGAFSPLPAGEPVQVTLSGKEADLRALLNGEMSLVKALLFGKLRISGDKNALLKLGQHL